MNLKDALVGKDPADLEGAISKVDTETIPAAQAAVEAVVDHATDTDLPKVEAAVQGIEDSFAGDMKVALDRLDTIVARIERIIDRFDGASLTNTLKLAPPSAKEGN